MKTYSVTIKGLTPLLINRFSENAEQAKPTRRIEATVRDPRKEAETKVYVDKDGHYCLSAFSIPASMGNAGASHKATGTRRTLRFVVPSAVRTTSDLIVIMQGEEPAKTFEVDSRPVSIPATKGRIMRHRPRWDTWNASFHLLIDDELLDPDTAHILLNEAGLSYGVGDFRPEKRGPFGTFTVTRWELLADGIAMPDGVVIGNNDQEEPTVRRGPGRPRKNPESDTE